MTGLKARLVQWGDKYLPGQGKLKILAALLGVYLVVILVLAFYWSRTPAVFDVTERASAYATVDSDQLPVGVTTTGALIGVVETLLEKPGGFLYNDLLPPGVWLDNVPSWEYGVLIQSRDLARGLREVLSRSQSQSTEDPDLSMAEPRLNFDADSWVLPASESQYREALDYLHSYLRRLEDTDDSDAQFYARADNLRYWLDTVDSRLGSLSQRLSASVGQRRLNTDLAGDASARQSTIAPREVEVRTPWTQIDNVFFEARGTAWALIHFLRAAEVDFADVLEKKNAQVSLQQIIRELEGTQQTIWSPMILNGSGMGLLANHSLVMASYISRANAAIIDLRELLSRG
ncbi:DUF2333 domain-containing protein [Kineobactrum sediminis]|uniref:DUF2333 domain-containing protein n=1 Tax=Kineobactrum sediminis TaxID=1905677 RepID=A0A2N5XY93_9GAMM|nr:DUF2333 family protein [Kineobactrum sediminis]PLW81082.1 DUF2333 domain-containing protein [Kineobactrum sediminis]